MEIESSQIFKAMLAAMEDLIFLFDSEGRYIFCHAPNRQDLYRPPEQLLGRHFREVLPPAIADQTERAFELNRQQQTAHIVYSLQLKGETRWFDASMSPIMQDEAYDGSISVIRDVTEHYQVHEKLQLAGMIFESTIEGICITDPDGNILMTNPAFSRITGYSADEILGRNVRILKSDRHNSEFYHQAWLELQQSDSWQGEVWNRRKNSEVYPEFLAINAIRDGEGRVSHYIAVFTDTTDIKIRDQQIYHQTYHDPLTNLPNRDLLYDRLRMAINQAERGHDLFALIFLNINNFKHVNSTLGVLTGDNLLKKIAANLSTCVRVGDTVAHMGADHFALLLQPGSISGIHDIMNIIKRIRQLFSEPVRCKDQELFLSASMGITLFPNDGSDDISLLRNADLAIQHARKMGKNAYSFYTEEMNSQVQHRMLLESELHHAIEENQFSLLYQPIVDANSGHVQGAESLIRWSHPQQGLISPADFIPLAEETGLIVPLTAWILEEVIKAHRRLPENFELAVNISAYDLTSVRIHTMLEQMECDLGFLTLELTENTLIDKRDESIKTMHHLKELGISFSIDDFGTGYSSLSYLKKFPIDKLKIDRSFVIDLPHDSESTGIARAIISLAKSLNMRLVAEGVETREQLRFMQIEKCDFIQGYYFSRPLPLDELLELVGEPDRFRDLI